MKKVYVALGILVVVGAVSFFVNYDPTGKGLERAPAKEKAESKPPAIDQNRVHAIELADSENRVKVARAGDQWVLPEKSNQPAMAQRVGELLKALQGLDRAELVSKGAATARDKAFGLEPESAKRLKLFDENNKIVADLWVGKPDMGGERGLQLAGNFIRIEGSDAVWSHGKRLQHLVMPLLSMWLEGRLFPMEPKDLDEAFGKAERVTLEFDDVPFTPGVPAPETQPAEPAPRVRVVLEGKDAATAPESAPTPIGPTPAVTPPPTPQPKQKSWSIVEPAGSGVEPHGPLVDQIVRSLLYGRADDVAGSDPTLAEYGLDRPFAEVEVRFSDGATRRLRIGNRAPAPTEPSRKGGSYRFAHVDGVPRVFLMNDYVLTAFRKKPSDLVPPQAPAPAAAPGESPPIELPPDAPETRK